MFVRIVALLLVSTLSWNPAAAEVTSASRIRTLLDDDAWQQALAEATDALARNPGDERLRALLGRALFRAGLLEESARELESLAESDAPPASGLVTLARLLAASGNADRAWGLLERALKLYPDDLDVLYWAGDLAPRDRALSLLEQFVTAADESQDADRIEAARGAARVFRALGDRAIWVAEQTPPRVEIPLTRLGDGRGGTVGFTLPVGLPPKRKPVRLLLDTGSHRLFVLERIARKRGFTPLSEQTLLGGGESRRHRTVPGMMPGTTVGGLHFRDALVTTTRREFEATGKFVGLLGVNVFGGYRVQLDLRGDRLILEQQPSSGAGEPYWWVSGQLLVRARTAGGQSGLFVLDTGATHSALSMRFARETAPDALSRSTTVHGFGGVIEGARSVRGVELEFQTATTGGGALVAFDRSLVNRVGGVEVSGLIGLDLLDGHRWVLDTSAQRIRLEPDSD